MYNLQLFFKIKLLKMEVLLHFWGEKNSNLLYYVKAGL